MILVLYNIILITNFKLIEMCVKSSSIRRGGAGVSFFLLFLAPLIYSSYLCTQLNEN